MSEGRKKWMPQLKPRANLPFPFLFVIFRPLIDLDGVHTVEGEFDSVY